MVLVPFFIVIKNFTANSTFDIIKKYIIKCHELQPLKPSVNEFEKRIHSAIEKSIDNKIPPIRIENIKTNIFNGMAFLCNGIFYNYNNVSNKFRKISTKENINL